MKLFREPSKEERQKSERRKDSAERMRRQHQIQEERRKVMRAVRPDLGPLGLW